MPTIHLSVEALVAQILSLAQDIASDARRLSAGGDAFSQERLARIVAEIETDHGALSIDPASLEAARDIIAADIVAERQEITGLRIFDRTGGVLDIRDGTRTRLSRRGQELSSLAAKLRCLRTLRADLQQRFAVARAIVAPAE